jgi:voltage-gated potassium channel
VKFLFSQLAYFLSEGEVRRNIRALRSYLLFLAAIVLLNTVLFHVLMAWEGQDHSWLSGLYWTLVVMTTLGFGDITFHSDLGRMFSAYVLLSGVVLLLVVMPFVFIRFFYAPWLEAQVRSRVPRKVKPDLRGHVVICAWDSIAPGLIRRLEFNDVPYVVVEPDFGIATRLLEDGVAVLLGDVESVETWQALRVADARLVFANAADPVNTNITLTVRELAPDVPVAAIATSPDSVDVLELSGANHVLPLSQRLGEQLANRVNAGHARCHVIGRYRDLLIAEFPVHHTPLSGRTIRETRLREFAGVNIIGIWEGGRLTAAQPDRRLAESSVPIVVGSDAQIARLDELLVIYDTNENPVLVLGGGKVGRAAARALRGQGIAVHLIEKNPALEPRVAGVADRVFIGDAADREVLRAAGLDQAPSVLLTTHDDAMNIYLAVYCRKLNPDTRIVSRVTHQKNLEAVLRAGADFVLSYASLGADSVMAVLLGNDLVVLGEGVNVYTVETPAPLARRSLGESGIGAATGLTVIGVQRDGRVETNPGVDFGLEPGDRLVLIGSREQRERFAELYDV